MVDYYRLGNSNSDGGNLMSAPRRVKAPQGTAFNTALATVGGPAALRVAGAPWWVLCPLCVLAILLTSLRTVFPQDSQDKVTWWREHCPARRNCACQARVAASGGHLGEIGQGNDGAGLSLGPVDSSLHREPAPSCDRIAYDGCNFSRATLLRCPAFCEQAQVTAAVRRGPGN
jgi:hypothetical protein